MMDSCHMRFLEFAVQLSVWGQHRMYRELLPPQKIIHKANGHESCFNP